MTREKPVELDSLPVRDGGEDQPHTHLSFGTPENALAAESCGACAQLRNDFAWIRFYDAMAPRAEEFKPRELVA